MIDRVKELRGMTTVDLAALGVPSLAYIRRVSTKEGEAYAINAADGTPIAVVADREMAFAAARQNDLYPVSVH